MNIVNPAPMQASILEFERSISESSQDPQLAGKGGDLPRTARQSILIQQNAQINLGIMGKMIGNAVADIIFGDAQPSGRLPITFPKSINQVPSFDDYNITNNRTYKYLKEEPLYPFGFGLGYAQFEYKNLKLAPETVKEDGNVKASVEITNKSAFAGEEVIQLYISDIEASVIVPKYELKKFKRISLKPGETRKIQFTITPEMLKFVDNNGERKLEPGEFKVFIGGSSPGKRSEELEASKPVSATFTLK